jgi:hypothetical protein
MLKMSKIMSGGKIKACVPTASASAEDCDHLLKHAGTGTATLM